EKEPGFLPAVLGMLADTPETHERVKAILDREEKAPAPALRAKDEVRTWLMQRSRFLRDELVKAAAEACFKESKYIEGEESLRALAKWECPKPRTVWETRGGGGEPRLAALAVALQLEHASRTNAAQAAEELRNRLKSIVTDRKAPGFARDFAVRGLLAVAW